MGSFTNWRGLSPENSLSRYNDSFFNKSFRRAWDSDLPIDQSGITAPAVNVREEETSFVLEFAAPGYEKSDFDIQIHDRTLTISAERKEVSEPANNGNSGPDTEQGRQRYTRREFYYHTFSRSFTLPENAEEEKINAKYNNGILLVEIPVKGKVNQTESPRKIVIG